MSRLQRALTNLCISFVAMVFAGLCGLESPHCLEIAYVVLALTQIVDVDIHLKDNHTDDNDAPVAP